MDVTMDSEENCMCNGDAPSFSIKELIGKKRDGQALSQEEIDHFIQGVVKKEVQGSQLGAMLMAMFLRGMDTEETTCLTRSMMQSGEMLTWPDSWRGLVVDKHSTGGVGDKVSLPLAPALAACGLKVPMISGRGLGYTGGTLDKLESIPGFNVRQSQEQMTRILKEVGCCIVGQTESLVPADRIMYATRDVSGAVESIPLISSSIVSKKAAESLDALVLDVKVGKAAFMKNEKDARALAKSMVSASQGLGIKTVAVMTKMDDPVGMTVGNALEVEEALHCLQGKGPKALTNLVCTLGGHLLHVHGKSSTAEEGYQVIHGHLKSGRALNVFQAMLLAQGVKAEVAYPLCNPANNVFSVLKRSQYTTELKSGMTGYVAGIDANECSKVCTNIGAGRQKSGQRIDHSVGLQLHVARGDPIEKGSTWATVHHNVDLPKDYVDQLQRALEVTGRAPEGAYDLIVDLFT